LYDWIIRYLAYFLAIKRTEPTLIVPDWHNVSPADIKDLDSSRAKERLAATGNIIAIPRQINPRTTRDSEVKLSFKFIETSDDSDWFGILLRNEGGNPWMGSGSFVFARLDGRLEIHNIPTQELICGKKEYKHLEKNKEYVLRVNIDGNHVSASLDEELESGAHFDTEGYQSPGKVYITCYRSFVEFGNVEFAQHDAIAFRT
jgi:hypothetical protein